MKRATLAAAMLGALALGPALAFAENETSASASASYYAMRDQPDFTVGVAAVERGRLRVEGRYNYEARDGASLFAGWKFEGGDDVKWQVTPLAGALFNKARGFVPAVEASVSAGSFDAYIEAEAVHDLASHESSFLYAWSEAAWSPAKWLRLGLVGQRTRIVDTDRDIQRGAFVQLVGERVSLAAYAFNPDAAARYWVVSLAARF
jgi:hypothetical protein